MRASDGVRAAFRRTGGDPPWLVRNRSRSDSAVTFVCFPSAGGSAAAALSWASEIPCDADVCAVEYPGRGSRRSEPAFRRINPLVAGLVDSLGRVLRQPFVLFGHSLGALIAFEFARQLRAEGGLEPAELIIAGCRAPSLPFVRAPLYRRSDEELMAELRRLDGTPDEVLHDANFARLFLPVLRADFELGDTYRYARGGALPAAITALAGSADLECPLADMEPWQRETKRPLTMLRFEGNHFFMQSERRDVLAQIASRLASAGSS